MTHDAVNAERHAVAMARNEIQCPQCPGGWLKYFVEKDSLQCVLCGYAGGTIKPNVATGALCHVSLRIDPKDAIAAHDGELYRIIAQMTDGKHDAEFNKLVAQERFLHESIDAARKKINDLAARGLRTLFSMGDTPVVTPTDRLELRLVLCKVTE
jgi:hypothetical protein